MSDSKTIFNLIESMTLIVETNGVVPVDVFINGVCHDEENTVDNMETGWTEYSFPDEGSDSSPDENLIASNIFG